MVGSIIALLVVISIVAAVIHWGATRHPVITAAVVVAAVAHHIGKDRAGPTTPD